MTLMVLARANCLLAADLVFDEDDRLPWVPVREESRETASSLSGMDRFAFKPEVDPEFEGLVGDI